MPADPLNVGIRKRGVPARMVQRAVCVPLAMVGNAGDQEGFL